MRVLFGLLLSVAGFLLVIYRVPVRRFMGQIGWAERVFGPGGTYTGMLLIGLAAFFAGLVTATNTWDVFLGGFAGRFFGSGN